MDIERGHKTYSKDYYSHNAIPVPYHIGEETNNAAKYDTEHPQEEAFKRGPDRDFKYNYQL